MASSKIAYGTNAAFTVTNLHSLASNSTWVAGWTSASVDNTTDLMEDYLITATFTTAATNRQAGLIRVYAYAALDKTTPTWPDLFSSGTEGTEGAATIHDVEQRDSGMVLLKSIVVDGTASAVYTMPPRSIAAAFGGWAPPYWALFVATNAASSTNAGFAASGSAVYRQPVYRTIA